MRAMIFCKRCGTYAADGLENCPKCAAALFDTGEPTLVSGTVRPAPSMAAGTRAANAMFGPSDEPAGHGPRFVALLIDSFLIGIIIVIGAGVTLFVGQGLVSVLILLLCMAVALAYEPYFIVTQGATPGKQAMGLRVVDKDGGDVGPGKAILRYVLKSILSGIFWIVALFTEKRQCLHDLIVGTYVVRA
jgi:uncharacterized RDD family membrane protein YckC